MSGFTETPSEPDLCVSTYPALRVFLSFFFLLSVVRSAFGSCTVCSSFMLTTENPASLRPACGFPALRGQVVAPLPTTTDAPSSGLIFRHCCHSDWSPLALRVQTRMIPV